MTADDLFRAGRLTEARASYRDALRARPDDARLLRRVGELSLYENHAEDALRYLGEAMARSPRLMRRWPASAAIRAQIAMTHYRLDRFPDASRQFAAAAGPMPVGPFRGLAGLARQLAEFGDDPPYRIEGPPSTRLEFVATDPLPTVELSVNGGTPALFFVDTGGAELVLDARFAASAGAEMAGALNGEYGGGKRAKTGLGRVGSIRAGDLRIGDVPIHTLDLEALREYFGIDIKGFLGTRLLMHFLATIDYPGGALTLRRDPSPARQSIRIPFWLVEAHLILVRGRVNGLPPTLLWVGRYRARGKRLPRLREPAPSRGGARGLVAGAAGAGGRRDGDGGGRAHRHGDRRRGRPRDHARGGPRGRAEEVAVDPRHAPRLRGRRSGLACLLPAVRADDRLREHVPRPRMSAPRRTPLTRERVVATALRIVDRDGLDALTMRALGRELGVDPMAVYHHLPNKAAILDGVVEAVLGEVPLDAPGELPWTEELAALARGYRDALRAHPNALPVVATRPDVSPAALRLLDTALGILLRAGFDAADALKAVHTASCLVVGHALDESGLAVAASEELSVADVAAMQRRGLETGEYPNLAAAAPAADGLAADDSFEAGLAALIAGFRPSIANGCVSGG